jgi:acetylcholinesterase
MPWQPHVSELEWQFSRLVEATTCNNATNQLSCLRGLSTNDLQAKNKASSLPNGTASPRWYWTAAVDGDLIRDFPAQMIASGKFIKVPILFGDDTDEGSSFAPNASTPAEISQFYKNYYPNLTTVDTDAINAQYPLMAPISGRAPYFPSAAAAYGESTFTCPGIMIVESYTQHANPCKVWSYRYNGQGPNGSATILVTHTVEMPAIFGTRMVRDSGTSFESYNAPMVDTLMNYWISFVKTLDPNPYKWTGAPNWDNYGIAQNRIKFQTNETAMEAVPTAQLERCAFWKGLQDKMEL